MAVLAYRPGAMQWIVDLPEAARVCGPAFADSTPLCGADANYAPPGISSAAGQQSIARAEFCQLAGYPLLDYDDSYKIGLVGIHLTRQGLLIG
ncbi:MULTISPECIES: hypothetical protein [Streptomyces]|uniref:hypothetical protein n=1 Tax=Streptomyces TaxID=1883 RepID=UPI0034607F5F